MKANCQKKTPEGYLRSLAFLVGLFLLTACQKEQVKEVRAESLPPDPMVAMINGEPVSAAEYRMVMERNTAQVYSFFQRTQNLEDHPGYWREDSGSEGPLARLRAMVREELVKIKVYQGLAKERGLLRETSFAGFQAAFDRENVRRSKTLAEGGVIYGPPQYERTVYYYIRQGALDYRLKSNLAKEAEAGISDEDIRKFYDKNRPQYGKKSFAEMRQRICTFLSQAEAERQLEIQCRSAMVKMEDEKLRKIVPRIDPEMAQRQ